MSNPPLLRLLMHTLLRPPPAVHSNPPPPAEPGPALLAAGRALRYTPCYLPDIAGVYAAAGTLAGADPELVEPEDLAALEAACEADGPREPLLPFPAWIEVQASYFRSLGSDAGDWLAAELQQLADLARTLRADTPEQVTDRRAALEQSMRESSFEVFLAREDELYQAGLPR